MTDSLVILEDLSVEALTEVAKEAAEQIEASARKAVEHAARCGRALIAIKEKLPHGEWGSWLEANWDYSQEQARRYMQIAANSTRVLNLKDANSIREALRMIADDSGTPKRDRKPSVQVLEPVAQSVDGEPDTDDLSDDPAEAVENSPSQTTVNTAALSESERQKTERYAMNYAGCAITQLKAIPAANEFRERAFDHVQAWMNSQAGKKSSPTIRAIERTIAKMASDSRRREQLEQILAYVWLWMTDEQKVKAKLFIELKVRESAL